VNLRGVIARAIGLFRPERKLEDTAAASPEGAPDERTESSRAPALAKPRSELPFSAIRELGREPARTLEAALSELRQARGTGAELFALQAVAAAQSERRAPDELVVAAAEIFVQRGQADRALAMLEGVPHASALLLAADIRAERGEVAHALTFVERILARDIEFAGARERQRRWSEQLGGPKTTESALEQPTLLVAEAPQIGLRIIGEAGRGGAGTVYEAHDDVLGRKVGLKVYHRKVEDRPKLEREARIAVSLAGPGVIRVFDADAERGFIVMEWVAGGALKGWLRRADLGLLLPLERWFVPLVAAVARVHAAGVVHADLKPANVLFRAPDQPVLSDFGAAHLAGERGVSGSLGYMSPERLREAPLTFSDDVYALGRILWDALESVHRAQPLDSSTESRWRALARSALAGLSERPRDASALLTATLSTARLERGSVERG
jgi:eukaryotic-like serine/threonine-protein kinase